MALCDELDGSTDRVAVADGPGEHLPLHRAEVKAVLGDTGLATMQKKWNEAAGKPVFGRKVVPDKVVRAPHCDSLCSTVACGRVKRMKAQLSHELAQLVADDKRRRATSSSSNLVFAFRAFRSGSPVSSLCGAVCEGVARAGVVKAQQTWVLLDMKEPAACGDTSLGTCLLMRHHQALGAPPAPCSDKRFAAATGMLCHATTDALAALVVCWAGNPQVAPDRVRVDSLLTCEIEGEKYWVTGERKAVISLDEVAEDPADDGDDCFLRSYIPAKPIDCGVSWLFSEVFPTVLVARVSSCGWGWDATEECGSGMECRSAVWCLCLCLCRVCGRLGVGWCVVWSWVCGGWVSGGLMWNGMGCMSTSPECCAVLYPRGPHVDEGLLARSVLVWMSQVHESGLLCCNIPSCG
jgi:hypothetical protein